MPNLKKLRKFNKSIKVEIPVDNIADQLLNTIDPNFKHREILVEAIIGTALDNKEALGFIYNAINGHIPDVNGFYKGLHVHCAYTTYMYKSSQSIAKKDSERTELGKCLILEVNPFRNDSILVEYDYYASDGTVTKDTRWVEARYCKNPHVIAKTVHEDIFQ